MMFFSWEKIVRASSGDAGDILTIMQHLAFGDVPSKRGDPLQRFYQKDFSGMSFLINPWYLVTEVEMGNADIVQAAEYISVASLRSIQDLLLFRRVYLPTDYLPFDVGLLTNNHLLRVTEDKVLFKYEFSPVGT